jgi:hypothetical protein
MMPLEAIRAAAKGLAHHPQDHGWRHLYRLFDYGLGEAAPHLEQALLQCYNARSLSATHLLTMLGIALKLEADDQFDYLISAEPVGARLIMLENILSRNAPKIEKILISRQNSFTCARRFLVSRVILSAIFSGHDTKLRFADLGTGLGVMPRQLNSRSQYDAFSDDLVWPGGIPEFRELAMASIFGVDRGPMPDLRWVHACYGPSEYYLKMYDELQSTLDDSEVANAGVEYCEIDLLDTPTLVSFVRNNQINAANMSYVLYELETEKRRQILETLRRELLPPGVLIVTEPCEELHRAGCVVDIYFNGQPRPLSMCFVSDGHFKGYVLPLDDYDEFIRRYPISYRK